MQQLVAQAGWTDPDLRFWHYRDKDQVEDDLIITRGRQTWGVEVKSALTAAPADVAGLRRLAEQCGADYVGGALLYAGDSAFARSPAQTRTRRPTSVFGEDCLSYGANHAPCDRQPSGWRPAAKPRPERDATCSSPRATGHSWRRPASSRGFISGIRTHFRCRTSGVQPTRCLIERVRKIPGADGARMGAQLRALERRALPRMQTEPITSQARCRFTEGSLSYGASRTWRRPWVLGLGAPGPAGRIALLRILSKNTQYRE